MKWATVIVMAVLVVAISGVAFVASSKAQTQTPTEYKVLAGCDTLRPAWTEGIQRDLTTFAKDGWTLVTVAPYEHTSGFRNHCALLVFRKP